MFRYMIIYVSTHAHMRVAQHIPGFILQGMQLFGICLFTCFLLWSRLCLESVNCMSCNGNNHNEDWGFRLWHLGFWAILALVQNAQA